MFIIYLIAILNTVVFAGIHRAPIIVKAKDIRTASRFPVRMYRLFKNDGFGKAETIPFQIDELNRFGDYILDQGKEPNNKQSNNIFDELDELSYMGDDVGPSKEPKRWPMGKPSIIYEIKHQLKSLDGSVYLGVYFGKAPNLSKRNYVKFNVKKNMVSTSRYHYRFDKDNYLVVKGVDMLRKEGVVPLLDSSTFYLKADLKYFLTLSINHNDINSYLEAYKTGPIRTVVRVTFFYRVLKMNFELGMFTEVSLFSNSVHLPAVMYNPLEGQKRLNQGSGFYYGFASSQNPDDFDVDTNMPLYKPQSFKDSVMNFFQNTKDTIKHNLYWMSVRAKDRFLYFEVEPSAEMLKAGNTPQFYKEGVSGEELKKRNLLGAEPLGKSPVNMGLYFDLTKFSEGEHLIAFRLYFENKNEPQFLEEYKTLKDWLINIRRL